MFGFEVNLPIEPEAFYTSQNYETWTKDALTK